MMCPKCHDFFRKQERHDKHVASCKGKICRNCGKIGHLACGFSISGVQLKQEIQKRIQAGEKITIIPL